MKSSFFAALLLATALPLWADDAATNRFTVLQRLEPARLQATRAARERFAKEREPVPQNGVYEDVRAALNVASSVFRPDLHRSPTNTFAAARKCDVRVVMIATTPDGHSALWRGTNERVIYFPGREARRGDAAGDDANERAINSNWRFVVEDWHPGPEDVAKCVGVEIFNRRAYNRGHARLSTEISGIAPDLSTLHAYWESLFRRCKEYPDELRGALTDYHPNVMQLWDRELQSRHFSGIADNCVFDPEPSKDREYVSLETCFRHVSTHLLLREVTEAEVRAALRAGRAYVAHDWLCDPTSFTFVAVNNLGTFHMGEAAPFGVLSGTTHLMAQAPLPAKFRLIHRGQVVSEQRTKRFEFTAKEPGAYRMEVWLDVAGEERPWIYSNPVYLETSAPVGVRIPPLFTPPGVEVKQDIAYVEAAPPNPKQMLNVFRPRDRMNAPVFLFLHGGAWRFGDRNQYGAFGNHFAREGIVTVVPSYRLAPQHPYPAQIEDAAAAFAWTVKNIAAFGGDPRRIYVGGHSAGGHLSAVLALDARHLLRHGLTSQAIHGVLALSGVYDLTTHDTQATVFGRDPAFRRDASPLYHVGKAAPPFLVTYCQWDYYSLPLQAKQLDAALR